MSRSRITPSTTVFSLVLALLLTVPGAASRAQAGLDNSDRQTIKTIIQAQLDAFQADDADKAFSFASPDIQQRFGTPDNFMIMVKSSYQAVYRPRAVFFQDTLYAKGQTAQQVLIIDQDNRSVMAVYPMERQADGSWRIDGCFLIDADAKAL